MTPKIYFLQLGHISYNFHHLQKSNQLWVHPCINPLTRLIIQVLGHAALGTKSSTYESLGILYVQTNYIHKKEVAHFLVLSFHGGKPFMKNIPWVALTVEDCSKVRGPVTYMFKSENSFSSWTWYRLCCLCAYMHTQKPVSKQGCWERLPCPTQLGPGSLTGNEGMTDSEEMTGTHAEKLGLDELCSPW